VVHSLQQRATALSLPASHRVRQNITSQDPKKRWYRKYNLVRISVPSIISIDYFSDPTPRKAQGPVCMWPDNSFWTKITFELYIQLCSSCCPDLDQVQVKVIDHSGYRENKTQSCALKLCSETLLSSRTAANSQLLKQIYSWKLLFWFYNVEFKFSLFERHCDCGT